MYFPYRWYICIPKVVAEKIKLIFMLPFVGIWHFEMFVQFATTVIFWLLSLTIRNSDGFLHKVPESIISIFKATEGKTNEIVHQIHSW